MDVFGASDWAVGFLIVSKRMEVMKSFKNLFGWGQPKVQYAKEKEILTQERLADILGRFDYGAVVYNLDAKMWNRFHYHGFPLIRDGVDFKGLVRRVERQWPDCEVVGVAGIAVPKTTFPQPKLIQHMTHPAVAMASEKHPLAYGTILTRDKITGKLNPLPNRWACLSSCANSTFVAEAMPQLLSGMGTRMSATMADVAWIVTGQNQK